MKMRLGYLVVGLIIGAAACVVAQRAWLVSRERGCHVDSSMKIAPGGAFRATLTIKTCGWGFGLAANFASVKLEKLGANGWFQDIELETDQPVAESPTMAWADSRTLEVVITSAHISGSLQLTQDGLHFTRRYVRAK